jgi:phenylacetate-CoA ligase
VKILHNLRWRNFDKELDVLINNSYLSLNTLRQKQFEDLRRIYSFAVDNVEYYKDYNEKYSVNVQEAKTIEDILSKLPIIDKEIIKKNKNNFFSGMDNYIEMTTGGSTGTPFSYRLDRDCYKYSKLLKYRGYSYAGYSLGDSLIIFGGGSLVKKTDFVTSLKTSLINTKKVSSYGVSEKQLLHLYKYVNKNKNLFIYGYASSIFFLALFIENNNLEVTSPPRAIFTTSEVLLEHQREKIESVFKTKIYNDYGINDGGGSAHECSSHEGMHLDMERSIIEVVDEDGCSVKEGVGKIIVTSLKNYSMPFIRYDTGDYAKITSKECKCGRETPRIIEIIGRTTDYLKFGSVYIGSPALTVLMGKLNLDLYQIIQLTENKIIIKILKSNGLDKNFKNESMEFINKSLKLRIPSLEIEYQFYEEFTDMEIDNKYNTIVNEYKKGGH